MKEGKAHTDRQQSVRRQAAAEPVSQQEATGTASMAPPQWQGFAESEAPSQLQTAAAPPPASETESLPKPAPPKLFWAVVRSGEGEGETYTVSSTNTSLELVAQKVYANPEAAIPRLHALNHTEPNAIIPNNTIINLVQKMQPSAYTQGYIQQGSMFFEEGVKQNPIPVMAGMGISSPEGFKSKVINSEAILKSKLSVMKIMIIGRSESNLINELEILANDPFTRYPTRFPGGGEYFKKMILKLRMATTTFSGDFGVSQWTNYYSMIFNRFGKQSKDRLKFLISMYAPEYSGDEGTKEVTYAGAVKETVAEYASEAFYYACKKLGYDPEEIKGFFQQTGAAVLKILTGPGTFISNLGKSVMGGVSKFIGKLKENIGLGLEGWLKDKLGGLGLPEELSLTPKGVLSTVMHVTGFTIDNIKQKLKDRIGPERVEKVMKGVSIVQRVFSEGPGVLVEMLQDKVSDIYQSFVGGLKDWALKSLVEKGIEKVLTFLLPGGGVIGAVKSIWKAVQWFTSNIQKIIDFIQTVASSISQISKGDIGGAIDYIYNALNKTISLGIDLLAKVLGIDKIGEKVKGIIETHVKAPADRLIDGFLDYAESKVLGKGSDKEEKQPGETENSEEDVFTPENNDAEFTIAGSSETHTLYVDERAGKPTLIIESTPTPLKVFIDNYLTRHGDKLSDSRKENLEQAKAFERATILPLAQRIDQAHENGASFEKTDQLLAQLARENARLSLHLKDGLAFDTEIQDMAEKYALEGQVGQYGSMPTVKGDQLTPDHQPQNAIFEWMAVALPFFATPPEGANVRARANKRSDLAYTINLQHKRHTAGRTYGRGIEPFKSSVLSATSKLTTDQQKRDKTIDLVYDELIEDSFAIKDVYSLPLENQVWEDVRNLETTPEEKEKIRAQVKGQVYTGQKQMESQPLDRLRR